MEKSVRATFSPSNKFLHLLSARIASASASISPFFRACDPKPQFHYLHNQQLCQLISDWLQRLAIAILIKILEI